MLNSILAVTLGYLNPAVARFYCSFNQPILLYLENLVTAGQVTEGISK